MGNAGVNNWWIITSFRVSYYTFIQDDFLGLNKLVPSDFQFDCRKWYQLCVQGCLCCFRVFGVGLWKSERMADTGKDYISNSADPKNIQDLTQFVSNFLLFRTFVFVLCLIRKVNWITKIALNIDFESLLVWTCSAEH